MTADTTTVVDELPATKYLLMEVLAARHRTGEQGWTFPRKFRRQLEDLERLGLVEIVGQFTSDDGKGYLRTGLTAAGRAAVLKDGYEPKVVQENRRLNDLLEELLDRIPRRTAMNELAEKCTTCPLRENP